MSKTYKFYCLKHGVLTIEVEKPPILQKRAYCPWCAQLLDEAIKAKEERVKLSLQPAPA